MKRAAQSLVFSCKRVEEERSLRTANIEQAMPPSWMTALRIRSIYFMVYCALGSLYPMLTQFYSQHEMTGEQLGRLLALGPVVAIVAQPFWGMICDKFRIQKPVLIFTLLTAAAIAVVFPQMQTYMAFVCLILGMQFFQSPMIPISDAMGLTYAKERGVEFGDLRLWGAVGFAVGVFVAGYVVSWTHISAIFYLYAFSLMTAAGISAGFPDTQERLNIKLGSQIRQLVKLPRYVLFLISAFFIFGPMNANNFYFALLYEELGGAMVGLGFAFLLFAGSEAPFMKWSGAVVRRIGIEWTLVLAGAVSAVRWLWYSTSPSTEMVLWMFFLQGISIGFFLTAGAQYVRMNAPKELRVTALSVYTSFGLGLGTMTMNYTGGIMIDLGSVYTTYLFFMINTLLGLIPLGWVLLRLKRGNAY